MTMPQAIRCAFAGWCTFGGRAGGAEYWWFVLFATIVFGLASLLDHAAFGRDALFGSICTLVFLMPYVGVAVRRLHDTDRSGWWLLLVFVPLVGNIVLWIWFCMPSTPGPNRFGPMPVAISDEGVAATCDDVRFHRAHSGAFRLMEFSMKRVGK